MQDQKGSALVLVMLTVAALLIVGVSLVAASTVEYRSSVNHGYSTQAFFVAEAGLNWARRGLQSGTIVLPTGLSVGQTHTVYRSQGFGGTSTALISVGELDIAFTRTASGWDLVAQGAQHQARRTVSLQITEQAGAGSGSILDRHHVRQGVSLSGSASIAGDVTAARVHLMGSPRISGNVEIVGATLVGQVTAPHGTITGTTILISTTETFATPTITHLLPSGLSWRGDFTAGWWPSPPYALPGTGQYGTILVESELVINVPSAADVVVRVGHLRVTGSGLITITGSGTGRVIFHVENEFSVAGSGAINRNGSSDKVDIFYHGSNEVRMTGATLVVGSLIANTANIVLGGSGGITGHILTGGNRVEISGAAQGNVRVLYAPNAALHITGSGNLSGVAVVDSFTGSGAASLQITGLIGSQFDRFANNLNLWPTTASFTFHNWNLRR